MSFIQGALAMGAGVTILVLGGAFNAGLLFASHSWMQPIYAWLAPPSIMSTFATMLTFQLIGLFLFSKGMALHANGAAVANLVVNAVWMAGFAVAFSHAKVTWEISAAIALCAVSAAWLGVAVAKATPSL